MNFPWGSKESRKKQTVAIATFRKSLQGKELRNLALVLLTTLQLMREPCGYQDKTQ